MQFKSKHIVGLLLLCPLVLAHAASYEECRKIAVDQDRLACFDGLPPPECEPCLTVQRARPGTASTQEEEPEGPVVIAQPKQTRQLPDTSAATSDVAKFGHRPPRKKLTEKIKTISAKVVSTRKKWPDDRIVYTLDNGQIWTQTRTQVATIFSGDAVTITKSRFGGYFLRGEGGAQVKVKRSD